MSFVVGIIIKYWVENFIKSGQGPSKGPNLLLILILLKELLGKDEKKAGETVDGKYIGIICITLGTWE